MTDEQFKALMGTLRVILIMVSIGVGELVYLAVTS